MVTGPVYLTAEEKEIIVMSIYTRIGYIETGEAMWRAADAERAGMKEKIKILSSGQMKLIVQSEGIVQKLYNEDTLLAQELE